MRVSGRLRGLFLTFVGLVLQCPFSTSLAQRNLADMTAFREGCQALEHARFEEAADAFFASWERLETGDFGEIERDIVASRLLESLIRSNRTAAAVAWLDDHPRSAPSPTTLKWSAIAFQAEHRFRIAAQAYGELAAATPSGLDPDLRLNHAISLSLSGETEAAYSLIQESPPPSTPAAAVDCARIAGLAGEHRSAISFLDTFEEQASAADSPALPESLSFAALSLRAWNLTQIGEGEAAAAVVVGKIHSAATAEEAHRLFLLLEQIRPSLTAESFAAALLGLPEPETNRDSPAAPVIEFFTGLLLSEEGAEAPWLSQWIEEMPDSPIAAEARLRLPSLQPESFEEIPSADFTAHKPFIGLPGGPFRVNSHRASVLYTEVDPVKAAEMFLELASETDAAPPGREVRQTVNAAIAFLRSGDVERYERTVSSLGDITSDSGILAELRYAGALFLAAEGDLRASQKLQSFIRDFPGHSSIMEAELTLAALHLNQVPARSQIVRELLDSLLQRPLDLEQSERLDYLAIWLEIIENNEAEIIPKAEAFLRDWPSSHYLDEISMFLARRLYDSHHEGAAREVFAKVAKEFPDSPYAEIAAFYAVKSAPKNADTSSEWQVIIEGNGTYASQAKHELALLHLSLDRFEQARTVLREIADSEADDSLLRFAAEADIGFAHYMEALAKGKDSASLEKAASVFASLATLRTAPADLRYSAAVRRGKCLELLDRPGVAVEIYRSIVHESDVSVDDAFSTEVDPRAMEWIFRAGFAAIRILAQSQEWEAAIRMADALSRKDGPRVIEASRLAEQLRLRHWIWN